MNMTNVLLGTTSLLLVVGLALTFGGFQNDRQGDSSKEEIAKLKEEIQKFDAEERAQELARLRASRPILPPIAAPIPAPAPMPVAPAKPETTAIPEDLQRVIDAQNDKIKTLEDEKEELAEAKDAIESENEDINEEKTKRRSEQSMAAFRVKNALAMGTVTTATKENGLVIFTPSASANFQPGKILAVRRNSGIIGHIEIDRLDETGDYVATMRPHGYSPDGYPDIQPGDTVIINLEG